MFHAAERWLEEPSVEVVTVPDHLHVVVDTKASILLGSVMRAEGRGTQRDQ